MAEDFCFPRIIGIGLRLSEPRSGLGLSGPRLGQEHEPDKADALFLLPAAWTREEGFPTEARIPGFWDAIVPIISGIDTDTVCSHHRPRKQVSSSGCCTSTFGFTGRPERLSYGLRMGTGSTGQDLGDSGACLR